MNYDPCESCEELLHVELPTIDILEAADGSFLAELHYFSQGPDLIFVEAFGQNPDINENSFLVDAIADVLEEEKLLKL